MSPATTSTSPAAGAMPAAPLADESPAYRYAGNGTFLPANAAAHEECRRFNAWVDDVNARTASRSAVQ